MRIATVAALAALVAAPAFAQAPAVPAAPAAGAEVFQVLRPTDKTMTCEQISSEANMLNAVIMQQQQQNAAAQQQAAAAEQKKAQGRAVAGRLLGLGAALGGQAAMMNGALNSPVGRGLFSAANQMAASASQAGAAPANAAAMPGMPATVSPQQQRMNMLLANYQTKGC
ncbi:MAG: hypothetical protein J0I28_06765 [Caulobacterales bacterium]|nr:hypothetical protein [Caulobacterales bacterium]